MSRQSRWTQVRGRGFGAFAVVLATAATIPAVVLAQAHARGSLSRVTSRESQRRGPVSVAVGAMAGDAHARELLNRALTDAITREPALVLQSGTTQGAALVMTAHVRTLSVQQDAAGVLARCEVGVVVSDGSGAVRAMFDERRVVRGGSSAEAIAALEETAVRGAAGGLVRDLVAQMVR